MWSKTPPSDIKTQLPHTPYLHFPNLSPSSLWLDPKVQERNILARFVAVCSTPNLFFIVFNNVHTKRYQARHQPCKQLLVKMVILPWNHHHHHYPYSTFPSLQEDPLHAKKKRKTMTYTAANDPMIADPLTATKLKSKEETRKTILWIMKKLRKQNGNCSSEWCQWYKRIVLIAQYMGT